MWEIRKKIKKGKYDYALVPEHPGATKNGYVLYHRIIMENYLGRILFSNEIVHHLNGDTHNNLLENLELMTREEHSRMHQFSGGPKYLTFICPNCGKEFDREKRNSSFSKGNKLNFCSRYCNGKYYSSKK